VLEALYCAAPFAEGSYKRGGRGGGASCKYAAICRIPPGAARGSPPSFIGQGEAAYSRAAQF
jgi:hypothetical protein